MKIGKKIDGEDYEVSPFEQLRWKKNSTGRDGDRGKGEMSEKEK
jgi:hypothetical protein